MDIASVETDQLHARLGLPQSFAMAPSSRGKALTDWRMEDDDAPIFRYLYRHLSPRRHLEFGTWRGTGTVICLESCAATVWTINLPEGEKQGDGSWSYYSDFPADEPLPAWSDARPTRSGRLVCQTDAMGFIGREYLERGLGHRVCQIYADSTEWDTSNYPIGFFDSVLIDGGHTRKVVVSDTRKAAPLVRSGGVVMWHDFCLDPAVIARGGSVTGVLEAIKELRPWLGEQFADLIWIRPSWILLGVKR